MKYALYFRDGDRPEEFLTAASELTYVKKDRSQLLRWLDLSDLKVLNGENAVFIIYEDGVPVFTRSFLGKKFGINWTAFKGEKV